jgi:hypothetical protein
MTIKSCINCLKEFQITDSDEKFYAKIEVPKPSHCPECRQQRRLAQGNHLFLYQRKCDATGKNIIANHHPDSPYIVYSEEYWWSDDWDPHKYAQDYDFSRPFFEQIEELLLKTPLPPLQRAFRFDENSDYTNYAGKNKNCYLIFDSDENRDCYYSYSVNGSESCMNCFRIRKCELCYECIDSNGCYNSKFLQDCENCTNSWFLKNCIGCKDCFGCVNLRNKQYYFLNKKYSKEEYEKKLSELNLNTSEDLAAMRENFNAFLKKYPQKYYHGVQNENVIGDYLTNCKNADHCFDSPNLWDCRYVFQAFNPLKDCMDIQECGDGELIYESAFTGYNAFNIKFNSHALGECSDLQYSFYCPHSSNLFGCVSLTHRKYCILNKQYTKEEYEQMVPQIIEHMKSTGEYGEYFPIKMSLFPYNETLAQEHFPLEKSEALAKGYKWRDKDEKEYRKTDDEVPKTIEETGESVLNQIFSCTDCGRNYRFVKQELNLLKQLKLPLSTICFHCSHDKRRNLRNKREIFDRNCQKCNKAVKTSYPPQSEAIIYCDSCYQAVVD